MKLMFKNTREKIETAKQHFIEHKTEYLTGAICFVGGVMLARRAVSVNTTVTVVNLPPAPPRPKPHPDIPGVYTFDDDHTGMQFLEHHFPLSMARHQKIKEQIQS